MKNIFKIFFLVFIFFSCDEAESISIQNAIKLQYNSSEKKLEYSNIEVLDSSLVDKFFLDTVLIKNYNYVIELQNKKIGLYEKVIKKNVLNNYAFGNTNEFIDTIDIKKKILNSELVISETKKKINRIISISPQLDTSAKFVLVNYKIFRMEINNSSNDSFRMVFSNDLKKLYFANDPNL